MGTLSIRLDQLPSGFRFHPTDQELINDYLKPKINGRIKPAEATAVPEIDVLRYEPEDLPAKSRWADLEWFFFSPVDRKYPTGNRLNRATGTGYWKSTGQDRLIRSQPPAGPSVVIGKKKSLVFHRGRAPNGVGTDWIMHEYRTVESSGDRGGFVLCRLFKKSKKAVSGLIDNEPEKSGFSPTATRSSSCSTLHRADDLDEEFATPLNQESPESDLQEELQPLTDTINKQSADKRLSDEEHHSIPYTVKPKESHFNSNMISDAGNQEAERAGLEMQPLPDTINKQSADNRLADEEHHSIPYLVNPKESDCNSNMISDAGEQEAERSGEEALFDELESLDPEYENLDKFLQTKLPRPLNEDTIHYDIDQGLHNRTPYKMFEPDSGTEVLDIMRSPPEESSADLSIYQTDSAINQSSDWNSDMDKVIGSDFDSEAPMLEPRAQMDTSGEEALFDELKSLDPEYENLDKFLQTKLPRPLNEDTIHYDIDQGLHNRTPYKMFEPDSGTEVLDIMRSPPEESSADLSIYQTDSAINQSSDWNSDMDKVIVSDFDSEAPMLEPRAQMDTSGIYNENHPPREQGGPVLEASALSRQPFLRGYAQMGTSGIYNENHPPMEQGGPVREASALSRLPFVSSGYAQMGTFGIYNENHPPMEAEAEADSDHEQSSSDDDGTASPTYMFVLTSEDYEKPTLRLKTRPTNEAGVKLESSSFHQEAPRVGSVPSVRIGVAVLIIFLLIAGTIWLLLASAGAVL